MAATDIGTRNVPPVDEMDNSLFDYDLDVFRDVDTNMDIRAKQATAAKAERNENGSGLGIDEEIKVTKKRAPVAKLDENRFVPKAFLLVDCEFNGSQTFVTCWYSKATENRERTFEIQRKRPRSMIPKELKSI